MRRAVLLLVLAACACETPPADEADLVAAAVSAVADSFGLARPLQVHPQYVELDRAGRPAPPVPDFLGAGAVPSSPAFVLCDVGEDGGCETEDGSFLVLSRPSTDRARAHVHVTRVERHPYSAIAYRIDLAETPSGWQVRSLVMDWEEHGS